MPITPPAPPSDDAVDTEARLATLRSSVAAMRTSTLILALHAPAPLIFSDPDDDEGIGLPVKKFEETVREGLQIIVDELDARIPPRLK